jgi:hypothetical protein
MADFDVSKRYRDRLNIVRVASAIVTLGSLSIVALGIKLLLDPASVVEISSVPTHAVSAKLFIALAPLADLGMGLFLWLSPKSLIFRLFDLYEHHKQQQIVRMTYFDRSFSTNDTKTITFQPYQK